MPIIAHLLLLAFLQSAPSAGGAAATNVHGVWLSWAASTQATLFDPGTVNIYRSTSTCAAATTFTLQATTATAWGPWRDPTAVSGNTYCYKTTALIDGLESNAPCGGTGQPLCGGAAYSNTTQVTAP